MEDKVLEKSLSVLEDVAIIKERYPWKRMESMYASL